MKRLLAALALSVGAPASGDVIYQTNGPFGGPFGLIGFDVFIQQSVGLRFTPGRDFTLDRVSVWIMSNDFNGASHAPVRVQVRESSPDGSIPGGVILEQMTFQVSAVGWSPVLQEVSSTLRPMLHAGQRYWIVLECDSPSDNPVWNWATGSTGFMSTTNQNQTTWQPGGSGAVSATIIEGTPVCYANCDGSTAPPILNVNDFICFQQKFAAGDTYANCDGSTATPILNVNDFICYQQRFAAGCP